MFSNCFPVSLKLHYRENSPTPARERGLHTLYSCPGSGVCPFPSLIVLFREVCVNQVFLSIFKLRNRTFPLCTNKNKYVTFGLGWGKEINLTYRKEASRHFIDFLLNRNGNSLLVHSPQRFLLLMFKSSLVKLTTTFKQSF